MAERTPALQPGYKPTELGPLPEEWEVVRLGDMTTKAFGGGTPSTKKPELWDGAIPWTTTAVIGEEDTYLQQFQRNVTEEGLQHSSTQVVPKGSVLIGTRVGVGKAVVTTFDVAINQDITALTLREDVLPEFLALSIKTPNFQRWFTENKRGTTIKGVPRSDVLDLRVPLPSLPEQRAIAHVLRTVQWAREATEKVIATTRELKKSLMAHLFTYGPMSVEEAGQVPLKETGIGAIPEHWEVVRLADFCEVKGGKRVPKGHEFADQPTQYPYIRVVDFKDGSIDKSDLKFLVPEDYEVIKRYTISSEDVYISIAGTIGLVGTIPEELSGANLTENAAKIVIGSQALLNQRFLAYFLSSHKGQEQVATLTTKTSQPKLALTRIKQILVTLPPLPEQREIANALSAVDAKISAEENRKLSLETLFKTLLYYLMTGRMRVEVGVGG